MLLVILLYFFSFQVFTSLQLLLVVVVTLGLGLVTSYAATNQEGINDKIDEMGGPGKLYN